MYEKTTYLCPQTSPNNNPFKMTIMKQTITFILFMLICFCGQAQSIDPALEKEMGQRKDDEKIRVFVIMRQQYDREQLCRRADYYTTRADRREFVVNELKQFAEATQYDIRQCLVEMERNDMVTTPKILWMANALYFSATKQAIYDLAKRKDVEIIGFDADVEIPKDESSGAVEANRDITPNVTQVKADQVWNLGYTGQGVVVAVVDTGVNYDHLDLKDHLWDGGPEFPNHGWDFGDGDNNPMDLRGHGTHCSGTVCGDGGAGRETGMAPDVTLMCVKITPGSGGSTSAACICEGIQWAVDHGCDVFSLSFGGHISVADKVLYRFTCENVLNAGVIGSISAGNSGNDLNNWPVPDNVNFPGGCPPPYMDPVQQGNAGGLSCSVCVGAVDYNDVAADISSMGPVTWANTRYGDYPYTAGSSTQFGLIRPDVCAPGVDIISADYSSISGYSILSGTSMAAPCVAGCMALMLSKNPELTPADICRILEETAEPLAQGKSNLYGYGRVDVLAAVNAVPDNLLSLASYAINDTQGNNNQQLNAGESVTMDMNLRCGPNALNNATLNITCNSEYVTITNGTIALPNFAAGQTQTVTGFAFTVDSSAPVRRKMTFYADVLVGGTSIGHFAFTLAVEGSTLVYEGATIVNDNNGNGILEPGETADLRVFINNLGNLTASSVTGTLVVSSNYLTINDNTVALGDVTVLGQTYIDFSVTLSASASNTFPLPCSISLVDSEGLTNEFGFNLCNITTTANLQGAGALAGAGTYGTGTEVSLTAIADNGHTFISWKKGNTVASYTDFSFNVSENANFVANFNAISNVVPVGQAIASDQTIPTHSNSNYSLTEQIYTTEELGAAFEISSVAFFNAGTTKTRNCRIFLKPTEKTVFQSGSDWVAVTENDLLFEGDITFAAGAWTTVYFDRAFSYDGIHNVILVVDDNTGTYSRGLACRVYDDVGHQAIYNLRNTNFDPYNPSLNPGYFLDNPTHKSQVLFGIASYDYTVSVSADPANCGTVAVDQGPFFYGQPCTATATPSGDNVFYYWTMDGTRVSSDATYRFAVESTRHLVAHFGPPVAVTVVADPAEGGTVSGGGSLGISQPTTLSATANPGYVFDHWDLNGNVVSYLSTCTVTVPGEAEYVAHFNPTAHGTFAVGQANSTNTLLPSYSYYKYSLTEQIYTADEIGGACHIGSIAFFNTGYAKTRDFTIYLVNTNKTTFTSNTDWIVPTAGQQVFSGEVTLVKNGWTTITFDNEFVYDGTSNIALIIDDNSGNWTYDHMSCRVYDADGYQAIRIYSDNTDYDPFAPSGYSGTRLTVKNQILLGLSAFHFTQAGNWSMVSNWQRNVIPGNNDIAFIDATCQLDIDAEVNSLTVSNGQTLTLQSGHILSVAGSLTNAATTGLVIEEGGQLVHGNAGVQATVQKTILPYTNNNNGWYLVASPIASNTAVTSVANLLSNAYDLYYYDEPTHFWINEEYPANNFVELTNGKGYLYANNEEVALAFAGELQSGSSSINVLLDYTEGINLAGFNLVGNPFAHNVASYASVNVANGCYRMNEAKDDLIVSEISEANPLKPAEGFFVKATGAGASVTFNPTRSTTANHSGSIRVELSDKGQLIDRLIVKMDGEPLQKMSLNEIRTKLFATQGGQEMAIVPCDGNEQPVSFKTTKDGTYTLNVNTDNMEFDYLHLIDNLTGADVDVLVEPSYTFEAKTTDYASRFRLVFSVCGDADGDGEVPFAFVNNGEIIIVGAEADAMLQIVDVLGHVIHSGDAMNRVSTGGLAKGVYVLRLIEGEKVRTQKIVID